MSVNLRGGHVGVLEKTYVEHDNANVSFSTLSSALAYWYMNMTALCIQACTISEKKAFLQVARKYHVFYYIVGKAEVKCSETSLQIIL